MQPVTRKRQISALNAATLMNSPSQPSLVLSKPRFHFALWLGFTLQNWILDVGRTVVTLLLPKDWLPMTHPGPSEFLHFLYNISTPLILIKFLDRSPRTFPRLGVHLGIVSVVMGASVHLVTEAIAARLLLIGYEPHLSLRENRLIQELRPSAMVDIFELLFYFDETLGHLLWFSPLYLSLFLFFSSSFTYKHDENLPTAAWILILPNAAYYWYLVTEGQTFILFLFTLFTMTTTVLHHGRRGMVPDANGRFMLYSFSIALLLVCLWVVCLWNDVALRKKHPGLIYVPQPRAVYTLYTLYTHT